jgi:hypothetical protein
MFKTKSYLHNAVQEKFEETFLPPWNLVQTLQFVSFLASKSRVSSFKIWQAYDALYCQINEKSTEGRFLVHNSPLPPESRIYLQRVNPKFLCLI